MTKKENKPINPFFSKSGGDISLAESVMSVVADSSAHAEPLEGTVNSGNEGNYSKAREWKKFMTLLDDYTGVKGQGAAVWIPTEVKKQIEFIRANAKANIPIRAIAAAMIMAFIAEHHRELQGL